jgi:hypothetical protein
MRHSMKPQHREAVERLKSLYQDDPGALALLLGGSIVKGTEQEFSDVDFMVVVSDEEFVRRRKERDFFIHVKELFKSPAGSFYGDGKAISLSFLQQAAERGSEPTRWSFGGVQVLFSRIEGLPGLIESIPVYRENERAEKIRRFHAQTLAFKGFFAQEAEKRSDSYLRSQAALTLALFGGRMILAHNRMLFPGHKWFMHELRKAPEKPANLIELTEALLSNPCADTTKDYADAILGFTKWDADPREWAPRYIEDCEWNWLDGPPPLADS